MPLLIVMETLMEAIFVRFSVHASKIVVLSRDAYEVPDYFPFQPRFGHVNLY